MDDSVIIHRNEPWTPNIEPVYVEIDNTIIPKMETAMRIGGTIRTCQAAQ